jgi:hypothetical protein
LILILLVLVAAYFFLVEERQRRESGEEARRSRMLLPYGPLDIDAVSFINPYGETIMWERDGDQWLITFPVRDMGEKSTIDMFLGQIAPGQKLEEFTGVQDLSQYGLDPPYAVVILESERYGRTDTLLIGGKTPTSFRAYVSLDSSRDVVVTRELAHNVMQKRLFHLRDKNFMQPAERNIASFSVHSPGRDLYFERSGGNWKVAGSTLAVDRTVVEPWLTGLTNALIYEFAAEDLSDTSGFGIGRPSRSVVLRSSGGDSTRVSFGKEEDSFVPAVRTGRDKVVMIESINLDAFNWTDDRLVVMSLSTVKPGDVAALQIETPDTVASWNLVGGTWMTAGPEPRPADDQQIRYLLMYIRSTVFEDLVTDRELVRNVRPDVIITLGDSGGNILDIISLFAFESGGTGGISISGGNAGWLGEGTAAEIERALSVLLTR